MPREAFFPPLKLKRSEKSNAETKVLYSADVSRHFGKGARIGLFVTRAAIRAPYPESIDIMIWLDAPPPERTDTFVRMLVRRGSSGILNCQHATAPRLYGLVPATRSSTDMLYRDAGESLEKVRYIDGSGVLDKVWLPRAMFPGGSPRVCWIEIW